MPQSSILRTPGKDGRWRSRCRKKTVTSSTSCGAFARPPSAEAREAEDRRAFERKNVFWKARLVLPEGAINCVVYDLSMGGARVRLVAQLQKEQRVRLDIEKLSPLNAEVVWLGIGMVGIRFTDDPAFIGRTLGPLLAGGAAQRSP